MGVNKVKPMAMVAEFVGTFGFVIAILASINGALVGISTAVVAAIALGVMVMSIGMISGAHVNPAVTAGVWSVKKIDGSNALAYVLAQFAGALAAFVVLTLVMGDDIATFGGGEDSWSIFFAELLGAGFFGFGIAAAVHSKYEGITAGATVGLSLLIGIGLASVVSNGIINPAVAAATDSFSWSYVLGPVVGAIVGMQLYARAMTKKGKL